VPPTRRARRGGPLGVTASPRRAAGPCAAGGL